MQIPAAAAKAVVQTAAGGSINTGIWTLVGIVVSTLGLAWPGYIKQWGPWKQADSAARDADFEVTDGFVVRIKPAPPVAS